MTGTSSPVQLSLVDSPFSTLDFLSDPRSDPSDRAPPLPGAAVRRFLVRRHHLPVRLDVTDLDVTSVRPDPRDSHDSVDSITNFRPSQDLTMLSILANQHSIDFSQSYHPPKQDTDEALPKRAKLQPRLILSP